MDIGCGGGAWLYAFASLGCTVFGYDFGIGVPEVLMVSRELYEERDLSAPLKPRQHYDLCISLEVAEHVKPEAADIFVENLCSCADVILFSAAIPSQPVLGM